MEIVTGLGLKFIFGHNDNWQQFSSRCKSPLRNAIIINVMKMFNCCSKKMGYHQYSCPKCKHIIYVPHSCKSKFCSPCGKKATDNWICQNFNILPKTTWQHITFSMPAELRDFFWLNRHLFNSLPALAADTIKKLAAQKNIVPGMFVAIHTFGRDLKRNPHIHLSVTLGGVTKNNTRWKNGLFFHHLLVKRMWRYTLINHLRVQYKTGKLKLPPNLKHVRNYQVFNSWLNFLYNKKWVVHLQKSSRNHKTNIEYLGKYLKRPPIGETRIKKYDGKTVSFEYLDHYDNTKKYITLPVMDFIAKVITHIHDCNFRCIRYFGFLANRVRGKLLPLVHKLLQSNVNLTRKLYISWRDMITTSFGYDPLLCPNCHINMYLTGVTFQKKAELFTMHQKSVRK